MDRRSFLMTLPVLATTTATGTGAEPPMLPILDTHQHLWDLRTRKLSWLKPGDPLAQNFTPVEYAAATEGLGVVKSIYMEVGVDADDRVGEADYVVDLCQKGTTTMRGAVIGARVTDPGLDRYLDRYKGNPHVKGVRDMLHTGDSPRGRCLQPEFQAAMRTLAERDLSFDLCVRPAELPDMVQLVRACPETRFILDHCGNPSVQFTPAQWEAWRANLQELGQLPNIVCKVSGIAVNGTTKGAWKPADLAPAVHGVIAAFGWDRVVFGGDWPVLTRAGSYRDWVLALREILANESEVNQRKLFHDNAARVYRV